MENFDKILKDHVSPNFKGKRLRLSSINLMDESHFIREQRDEMGRFIITERQYMLENKKIRVSLFGEVSKGPEGIKWRIFAEEDHRPLLASSSVTTSEGTEGKNWPFVLVMKNSCIYIHTSDRSVKTYWIQFKVLDVKEPEQADKGDHQFSENR